jgi:hypothetical protein
MRSGYIASANVSTAQSLYSSGTRWQSSSWLWDPWYGAYTFIPAADYFFNPFGWGFWSPTYVVYAPTPVYRGFSPGFGTGTGSGISRNGAPAAGARTGGVAGTRNGGAPSSGGFSSMSGMARSGGGGFGGGMSHGGGGGFGGGHSSGGASGGHGK